MTKLKELWASTGTKNPAYHDTLCVDQLVGADTVNTKSFDSLISSVAEKRSRLKSLAEALP